MQQQDPPSRANELVVYVLIMAAILVVFIACASIVYATNFDHRQSLFGFGVLFVLFSEFVGWMLMRYDAETDERRNAIKGNRANFRRMYVWLLVAYFVLPRIADRF